MTSQSSSPPSSSLRKKKFRPTYNLKEYRNLKARLTLICYFCRGKYTPTHLCGEVAAYAIMHRFFLDVLYDTQPRDGGELFVNVMKKIREENLFPECRYIERAVVHYMDNYFLEEYDVS